MATTLKGIISWSGSRDEKGHREYKIVHLVQASVSDGPGNVLVTAGLPLPGAVWFFGIDLDLWAWCRPNAIVQIHQEKKGDPNRWWTVEQTFSTKPIDRCHDDSITDPIAEPWKVSGSFIKYSKEYSYDRFGQPIDNSAYEQIRGPQAEFDANRPTVRIEHNTPILAIEVFSRMVDTVNDLPMWGFPARCIKLSNVSWERKYHGTCYVYYTRTFEFDIDAYYDATLGIVRSGFDRNVLDEGTKVLRGRWDRDTPSATFGQYLVDGSASVLNPADFIAFQDKYGNHTSVMLDGAGAPATSGSLIGEKNISVYRESNFFLLYGIPSSF